MVTDLRAARFEQEEMKAGIDSFYGSRKHDERLHCAGEVYRESNPMVRSRSKKAHSRQQVETAMSSSCIHQFGFPMLILTAHLLAGCAVASNKPLHDISQGAETVQGMAVVAGCASCILDMPGATGCDLAVKIDGTAYLVTGSNIDDHGDAHASDGLCNAPRDAVVEGRIDGDRFVATHFAMKPGVP